MYNYKSQACLSATFGQRGVDLILSPAAFDSRNPVVVVVVKFFVKLAISWQETHPKEIKSIKLNEQIYSYRADWTSTGQHFLQCTTQNA